MYKKYKTKSKYHKIKISIKNLCSIAKVSESGFYKWKSNLNKRSDKESRELNDYITINKVFQQYNMTVGFRSIVMKLKDDYNICMNHKKVIRIMRKYNLTCKIRKTKSYKNSYVVNREENTYPNLLNTVFDSKTPNKIFHTDITYIKFGFGQYTAYLSAIKDQASKEIVAYKVSNSLEIPIVLDTLKNLEQNKNTISFDKVIIHSDQGAHYTSKKYRNEVNRLGLTASMSRRGKCVDNSPIETFFGHMKDEINFSTIRTYEEVEYVINRYINYYNTNRPQWKLKKMTPEKYRNHLLEVA